MYFVAFNHDHLIKAFLSLLLFLPSPPLHLSLHRFFPLYSCLSFHRGLSLLPFLFMILSLMLLLFLFFFFPPFYLSFFFLSLGLRETNHIHSYLQRKIDHHLVLVFDIPAIPPLCPAPLCLTFCLFLFPPLCFRHSTPSPPSPFFVLVPFSPLLLRIIDRRQAACRSIHRSSAFTSTSMYYCYDYYDYIICTHEIDTSILFLSAIHRCIQGKQTGVFTTQP
eukprot:m.210359 g.210359  ORF g.210359 m.210359 type:complete len:221 (-) comp16937_c0_seq81:4434-5096(-)